MRGCGTPKVRISTAVCLWDFCSLLKWIFMLRIQELCRIKHTGLGDCIRVLVGLLLVLILNSVESIELPFVYELL